MLKNAFKSSIEFPIFKEIMSYIIKLNYQKNFRVFCVLNLISQNQLKVIF